MSNDPQRRIEPFRGGNPVARRVGPRKHGRDAVEGARRNATQSVLNAHASRRDIPINVRQAACVQLVIEIPCGNAIHQNDQRILRTNLLGPSRACCARERRPTRRRSRKNEQPETPLEKTEHSAFSSDTKSLTLRLSNSTRISVQSERRDQNDPEVQP